MMKGGVLPFLYQTHNGECFDLISDFHCDCSGTGYTGRECNEDIDDCLSEPCENDGVCKDKGANDFKCTCNEFWTGDTCSDDVDDCILKGYLCENGAICEDDPVNMGDVICTCIIEQGGFTGKYCDVPIEDACVTFDPCLNGGKCIVDEITKEMSCDCANTGYEGDVCDVQVYVSECISSPCLNGGQCYDPSDLDDDWYCECTAGYSGRTCEFTECDSNPCQNGGTCTNVEGGYVCVCVENYAGPQCQVDENDSVGASGPMSSSSSGPFGDDTEVAKGGGATNKTDFNTESIVVVFSIFFVLCSMIVAVFYYRSRARKDEYVMPT